MKYTKIKVACKFAAMGFQMFFMASFSFMALEALQAFCMKTMVITSGGYFSRAQYFILGWGGPVAVTLVTAMMKHNELTSFWS